MIKSPIWKDIYYNTPDSILDYQLKEGDDVIHTGYSKRMPDKTGVTISINTRVEEYLNNDFHTDIRDIEDEVVLNEDAYKEYDMYTNSNVVETYGLLYDWSYEDVWTGQTEYVMTNTINGHLDPRMKLMFTMFNTGMTAIDVGSLVGFQIYPNVLNVPFNGGNYEFAIISDDSRGWRLDGTNSYGYSNNMTLSTTAGTGTTIVGLDINWETDDEIARLVFKKNNGDNVHIDIIRETDARLIVSGSTSGDPESIETVFYVYSPVNPWTAYTSSDWLASGYTGNTGFTTIHWTMTKNYETSRTAVIEFTDGITTSAITFTQIGMKPDGYYDYLTFNIVSDGTIVWDRYDEDCSYITIEYRKNGGEWYSGSRLIINVSSGDTVEFRGENQIYSGSSFGNSTAKYTLSGNIMSMVYGYLFPYYESVSGCAFTYLFYTNQVYPVVPGNTSLLSAEKLVLPATELGESCYAKMFVGCVSLEKAPKLPATTLAPYCYESMFRGCTSLTTAPELPAMELADYCYYYMFASCTGLTTTPALPATALTHHCYESMFAGCTSLTTAPELLATAVTPYSSGHYNYMFAGCTSLVNPPSVLPNIAGGYYGMFSGCTSLTTGPVILSVNGDMSMMFNGCTSLNYLVCLAIPHITTDPVGKMYSYLDWMKNVPQTGTFVKNPNAVVNTNWTRGDGGIPYGWTILDYGD